MDPISKKIREHPQFNEGRAEADHAISNNLLGYRLNGKLDREICEQSAKILQEQYQIFLSLFGFSVVPMDKEAKDEGYNERMMEEFHSRFGNDVIEEVFRKVERKRKKKR